MKDKLFISFAFTGQAKEDVEARLGAIFSTLQELDVEFYCNYYDPIIESFTSPGQYIKHATEQLKNCRGGVLALVATEHRSEGQLLELGAAYGQGLPIRTLVHESVIGKSYINDPSISTNTATWDSLEGIPDAIRTVLL